MTLETLRTPPTEVQTNDALIARLDACIAHGFARLAEDQLESLQSLANIFTGTPLESSVQEAVDAIQQGALTDTHISAFAIARASLLGASHDALLAHALSAHPNLTLLPPSPTPPKPAEGPCATIMESARQWLLEISLGGLKQLDRPTLIPFLATLETLQEFPELQRLSALLTGFVDELIAHAPTSNLNSIPTRRWSDLWCRSVLLTSLLPPDEEATLVSGTFHPVGGELRHHDHIVSLVVYGALERSGEPTQIARATATAWKVSAVGKDEMWKLLGARFPNLVGAFAGKKSLTVKSMPLYAHGDLVWDEKAATLVKGKACIDNAKTFLTAEPLHIPSTPAHDRHPVRLALPVYFDKSSIAKDADSPSGWSVTPMDNKSTRLEDLKTPLGTERLSALALSPNDLAKASGPKFSLAALARYDGGHWALQPIACTGKEGLFVGVAKAIKAKTSTASTLQERASKLLRKKA